MATLGAELSHMRYYLDSRGSRCNDEVGSKLMNYLTP